jgi:mannose-6-phosphate isomerase-like protein (cupin superfamily)
MRLDLSGQSGDPTWAAFQMQELLAKHQQAGKPWFPFLALSTMTAGVYVLPEAGVDPQEPHQRDELYFVVSGKAKLQVEDASMSVGPGSTVFVKARVDHRFFDIEEELKVLVFFSTADP